MSFGMLLHDGGVPLLCAVVTYFHVRDEWKGNLSARLADLYHARPLPPVFYAIAAVLPTAGLVLAGLFLPQWRPYFWLAAFGGYVSDRAVVHGWIEDTARASGAPSMPGSAARWRLVLCAGLLAFPTAFLVQERGLPAVLVMVVYTAGWVPFLALLPLQAALRIRR